MRAELGLAVLAGLACLALGADRARAAIAPTPPARPRVSSWTPPAAAAPYLEAIGEASARYDLPDGLLARVLYQESHFRADVIEGRTSSSAGAIGIAQFTAPTAADYNVDPFDPFSSIDGAAHYLADLYARFGDWALALGAYNWGPGNLARRGISQLPPESRAYATEILNDVQVFS